MEIEEATNEYLTAEQVLVMADEFCEKNGNPYVAKGCRLAYEKKSEIKDNVMPTVVMKHFNLERVVLYRRKPS